MPQLVPFFCFIQWGLSSPPKPYAFVSLPVQSLSITSYLLYPPKPNKETTEELLSSCRRLRDIELERIHDNELLKRQLDNEARKDGPSKDAPSKDGPSKDAPSKDATSKGDAPSKDIPSQDIPSQDTSSTDIPYPDFSTGGPDSLGLETLESVIRLLESLNN